MSWAAVGVGAAQLAMGAFGASSANKKAESAAKQQAQLTQMKRTEEIRQRIKAAEQQAGTIKAKVAASGLLHTGSAARFASASRYENMREIAYAKEAARKEQRAIRKGAQGAGDSILWGAAGQALGTVAGGLASQWGSSSTPTASGGTNVGPPLVGPQSFNTGGP